MSKILSEIISVFFKLGLFAFGGPAAHIAMMHKEVVDKRKWIDDKYFLELIGLTSLIPGPNSTEMVIHCGYLRGKWPGLILAGLAFILPASLLTFLLAYLYVKLSGLPNFDEYVIGIKPVVIILIFDALRKLWKKAIDERYLMAVAALVFVLGMLNVGEALALLVGSILGFSYYKVFEEKKIFSIELTSVFLVFAKIGSILFGSGYVLIAYLQDELVYQRGWITTAQLADAIGIGQITPGPVLSTATFIGYLVADYQGAILATIGIFAPSFFFVWLMHLFIPTIRKSKSLSLLLKSVNAGVIGMMAYALVPLLKMMTISVSYPITLASLSFLYFKFPKISSVKLLLIGLVLGYALQQIINFV